MLKARNLAGTTFTMLFRIEQNQITFYETPSTAQLIVFPYVTRSWVRAANGDLRDNLQADDDVVLYDSQLFKAKLELDFRRDKGFDVTLQEQTYDDLLEVAIGRDTPGRTLSLAQRNTYPYLGVINIPDTGYGS
jgi:S-adenosylmethionine:tRNA-ribosyltransferase-isomerase (queuine synthetase)